MKTRFPFLPLLGLAAAGALALLTSGCDSYSGGGEGMGYSNGYYPTNYYDPFYYSGGWYGGGAIIVTPPVRPVHPIAPRPMPMRR